eukprot:4033208-Prymnesium_polylepis.1
MCNLLVPSCRARAGITDTAAMAAAGATSKGGTTLDVAKLVRTGNAQRDGAHFTDDQMCAHSLVKSLHEGLTGEPRCLAALGDLQGPLARRGAGVQGREGSRRRRGGRRPPWPALPKGLAPTSATAEKSTRTKLRPRPSTLAN